jgi:hypothetical protein
MYTVEITVSAKRTARPDYRVEVEGKSYEGAAVTAMRRLELEEAAFIRVERSVHASAGFSHCLLYGGEFTYYSRDY